MGIRYIFGQSLHRVKIVKHLNWGGGVCHRECAWGQLTGHTLRDQVQSLHHLFVLTCDGGAGEGGPKTLPRPCHFCSLVIFPLRCKDQFWVILRVGFQFLHTHTSVQAHISHIRKKKMRNPLLVERMNITFFLGTS